MKIELSGNSEQLIPLSLSYNLLFVTNPRSSLTLQIKTIIIQKRKVNHMNTYT